MTSLETVSPVHTPAIPNHRQLGGGEVVAWLECPAVNDHHQAREYAGAGSRWRIPAQSVAIVRYSRCSSFLYASRRATRFDDWFQNRIGACLGSDNRDRTEVEGNLGMQLYDYTLGEAFAAGRVRMAPGWQLVPYDGACPYVYGENGGRVYGPGKIQYKLQRIA